MCSVEKSKFVTVIAWIFIVIGGFSTVITLLQNVMLMFLFPKNKIAEQMNSADAADQVPEVFRIVFSYLDYFFFIAFLVSLVTFISAISLLKRKNWARIVFIFLMSLGIVWNFFGVALQFFFMNSFSKEVGQVPPEFQTMWYVFLAVLIAMVLAISGLFLWIIMKLRCDSIKREFV